MYDVNLLDGSFVHQKSFTLGGENSGLEPDLLKWHRSGIYPVMFITDMFIIEDISREENAYGLLIEPNSLSDNHYHAALRNRDDYDCILTFSRDITESEPDFMYYPLGGSWIHKSKWGIHPKSQNVSIMASQKKGAVGHRLRHNIISGLFEGQSEHVFGRSYREIDSKCTALTPYRYSVVVESCQMRGYFSEKIVDCISQGTVPIYWGCPDIGDFFDRRGLLIFETIDELDYILHEVATEEYYYGISRYIQKNYEYSQEYRCAEDWIAKNYPFLFEPCK